MAGLLSKSQQQRQMEAGSRTRQRSRRPRGYKLAVLVDASLVQHYLCGLCELILKLACQVECGHQFCQACVEHLIHAAEKTECPLCKTEGDDTEINATNYQSDFACRKNMAKLHVKCEYADSGCSWLGRYAQIDEHLGACEFAEVICEACHQLVARQRMNEHQEIECIAEDVITGPCMFGCQDLPPDVDLQMHNEEYQAIHLNFVLTAVNNLKRLYNHVRRLSERINLLPERSDVNVQLDDPVEVSYNECIENIKKMDTATKTSTNLINVAYKEVQRIAVRLVELEKKFQMEFLGGLNGEHPARQAELDQLWANMSSQVANHSGVLFWEITNVDSKLREAQASTHISMDSPVFFTGHAGHAICSRVYLNGDGTGAGSHISLFVVLKKGRYDGMVKWPMNELIKFTLLDQSGKCEHHVYRFATDPLSSSFQKPKREMNIASGCPQFISLTTFRQRYADFVVDNTMMLEVRIEKSEADMRVRNEPIESTASRYHAVGIPADA